MPLDKGIYFCIKYYLYIIYLLYGWGKLVSSIQVQQGAKITPVPFEAGETLLSALQRAGYSIPAACGGKGRCGKCRVKVNGVPRLACKTKAQDGDWIDLPETMRGVILTDTLTLPKAQRAARALARQSTSVRRRWRCGSSTAQTESCSRRLRTGTRRRPTART